MKSIFKKLKKETATFIASAAVLYFNIPEKLKYMLSAFFHINGQWSRIIITFIFSLLIIISSCFLEYIFNFPFIKIEYFSENKHKEKMEVKSIHITCDKTENFIIKVTMKFSKLWEYLFNKTDACLFFYFNPMILQVSNQDDENSGNLRRKDKGVSYKFTKEFSSISLEENELSSRELKLLLYPTVNGEAWMHVQICCRNEICGKILTAFCRIHNDDFKIWSER